MKYDIFKLTHEEAELLKNYRLLDDRGKATIIESIDMQLNYTNIEKRDKFNLVKRGQDHE